MFHLYTDSRMYTHKIMYTHYTHTDTPTSTKVCTHACARSHTHTGGERVNSIGKDADKHTHCTIRHSPWKYFLLYAEDT